MGAGLNFVAVVAAMLLMCFAPSEAFPHFTFCHNGIPVQKAYAQPMDQLDIFYMQAPGGWLRRSRGRLCFFGSSLFL